MQVGDQIKYIGHTSKCKQCGCSGNISVVKTRTGKRGVIKKIHNSGRMTYVVFEPDLEKRTNVYLSHIAVIEKPIVEADIFEDLTFH